jgi:hypothetical protein
MPVSVLSGLESCTEIEQLSAQIVGGSADIWDNPISGFQVKLVAP